MRRGPVPRIGGSKAGLRSYLESRVGVVVDSAELQAAANGAAEWARRLRELRAEGWKISSHNDRADLKPGQYMLEAPPPAKAEIYRFEKPISSRLRAQVLERNGYTCQMCGIGAGDLADDGRKARLHIGHIKDRDHGGLTELGNLRALCSTCNQGAKNIAQEPPSWTWLKAQVRRASETDQREILRWLSTKFREKI